MMKFKADKRTDELPFDWQHYSVEQLEQMSTPRLIECYHKAKSDEDGVVCGSCLYGVEDGCTCGAYFVSKELIAAIIDHRGEW